MIREEELIEIGKVNKPHGIKGELSVSLHDDRVDLGSLRCVIIDRDGIPVPFFISSLRPRSSAAWLVTLDGVDSDAKAKSFTGVPVRALRAEVEPMLAREAEGDEGGEEAEGFYANDLMGLRAVTTGGEALGTVEDIDDSTANILMVIRPDSPEAKPLLVPLAGEFIEGIDPEGGMVTLELPPGLLDL